MFRNRTYKKELLDGDAIPFADIRRNMQELDFINQRLGGHRITLDGFQKLAGRLKEPVSVVEIGCGGGDNLRVLKQWAHKKGLAVTLSGIDWNKECILFAQQNPGNKGISFIHNDYRKVILEQRPHIIFSSLFCHHFTDEELVEQLDWMRQNCTLGFFINDLHRHPLAYYSIKGLTHLFSKSYLVKNDAPLSVRRSFIKKDWERLLAAAQIDAYSCTWKWAFRWLVVHRKRGNHT